MIPSLKSLIEILREVRSGSTWMAALFWLVFVDCYLLLRFERSVISLVQSDPSSLFISLGSGWVRELLLAVGWAAAVWFYLLPMVLVPFWRWVLYTVALHAPDVVAREYPKRKDGWVWLESVRQRAMFENNPLLMAAWKERADVAKERNQRLTCVLGSLLTSFVAALAVSDGTGLSLMGAGLVELEQLPKLVKIVGFLAFLPAGAHVIAVLLDAGAGFDDYIHMPELAELPEPSPRALKYRAGAKNQEPSRSTSS